MARKRLLSPETQPRSVKVKREDDDVPNIKREVSPENDTTDAVNKFLTFFSDQY